MEAGRKNSSFAGVNRALLLLVFCLWSLQYGGWQEELLIGCRKQRLIPFLLMIYLFCLLLSHTFLIAFVQYTHPSPFTDASLRFLHCFRSAGKASLGCRAGIWTRASRTAGQRATNRAMLHPNWAKLHPYWAMLHPYWATLHPWFLLVSFISVIHAGCRLAGRAPQQSSTPTGLFSVIPAVWRLAGRTPHWLG